MRRFTPERHPNLLFDEKGRVRVQVVSVAGKEVFPGIVGADPPKAQENMNSFGWCEEEAEPDPVSAPGYTNPKIELDNGETIWGIECWWAPVEVGD